MSTRNRLAAVLLCAGTLTGVAYAQPALTEDLGALPNGTLISRNIPINSTQLFWFKITIPELPASSGAGALFLDIRTNEPSGGTILDTEIGLYTAAGDLVTSDDDDGPGTASALAYGASCPPRANLGAGTQSAGVIFDGRDGALPAGEYYLVVAPYNATFNATNWNVTTNGTSVGNMNLEILLGAAAADPILSAGATSPSTLEIGSPVLVTVTAPCNAPDSLTADLSAIGGGSAVAMFNDGTNGDVTAGDNVWSILTTVAGSTPQGTVTLGATATNAAGSTSITFNVNAVTPPAVLSASGGIYTEVEDNNNKGRANRILSMNSGEAITGLTTGTSTSSTASGTAHADYFRVATAPAPLGIYRHRLAITNTGAGTHTASIRGLTQSAGVISATSDAELQVTTAAVRLNQWYGFGKGEMVFYRVVGSSTTTGNYVSTLTTEAVTPVALGSFAPGQITISTVGQGHATDTDMWVYDANLNAIPDFGNDDESITEGGTGSTIQSQLRRNFAEGTYYVMISTYNTANNLPSPATDDFRSANVLDFPNAAANSATATAADMRFAVTDANGTQQFPASKDNAFDIFWATFTVGSPAPTCGTSDFNGDGDFGTDADIEAFFACLGGNCCDTCFVGGADFNMDGDTGTDADIEAFFRVLAGGEC